MEKIYNIAENSENENITIKLDRKEQVGSAVDFVLKEQLYDASLWELFVKQFKSAADDKDNGWRGEYFGKMLRGGALICKFTKDEKLYKALEKAVVSLLATKDAEGRISSYSKEKEFNGWDIWCRKYITVGLQYFLEICENIELSKQIVKTLKEHCDYIMEHIGPEEQGKKAITKASTHWKGLNSSSIMKSFIKMYELTNQKKYLEFAEYIINEGGTEGFNIFKAATKNELMPYQYPVTKAYEMISNFEGLLEHYKVTGNENDLIACVNFAEAVLKSDFTIIGGIGCFDELFDNSTVKQTTYQKTHMQETCVSVSLMIYLYELYLVNGKSSYLDRIETMFYNLYLGSLNTEKCTNNFGLPFDSYSPLINNTRALKVGGKKLIAEDTYYGCCAAIGAAGVGIMLLGLARVEREKLSIDFLIPSKVSSQILDCDISLDIQTKYPFTGAAKIILSTKKEKLFAISIRLPDWCENYLVKVNGVNRECKKENGYINIYRKWQNNDVIELDLDIPIVLVKGSEVGGDDDYFAVKKGAVVFAADKRLCEPDKVFSGSIQDYKLEEHSTDIFKNNQCLKLTDNTTIASILVDYSSAGKTWDETSRMSVWLKNKS